MRVLKTGFTCISIALLAACNANVSASLDVCSNHKEASVAESLAQEMKMVGISRFIDQAYKAGVVRHIVIFRYKETVSTDERREITRRFLALQRSLRHGAPYIVSIEQGAQSSGERLDKDFEQAFLVTFRSEGDRNYYVGKPVITNPGFYDHAHQEFKEFVGAFLAPEGALVFDYSLSQAGP